MLRAVKVWMLTTVVAAGGGAVAARAAETPGDRAGNELFETKIRPVLEDQCFGCHSAKAKKIKGKLRLDSFEAMTKGGDSGKPSVVAGEPDKSLMIEAMRYVDKGDDSLLMPPPKDGKPRKLPADVIADFERWVKTGAPHPASFDKPKVAAAPEVVDPETKEHWAFKRPTEPAVPLVKDAAWVKNPVDAFILAKLDEKGLKPAPPANRSTLLRRVYFDLIGLPPAPDEVDAFASDPSPDAFAKVVDRLLADPRYGERWGRYWLDVARYADTKGYVFEEERRYPYAYTFRDYVIRSFNEDKPYDQFIKEQVAADQLPLGDDKRPLAAMGFLTLGRRFLNAKPDIIDDRLDVLCRGTMGMTVGCARCHDHKFDPIPTKDYYALYAVFNNSVEPKDEPLIGEPEHTPEFAKFEADLKKLEGEREAFLKKKYDALVPPLRSAKEIAEYLVSATSSAPFEDRSFVNAGLSGFVRGRWKAYLADAAAHHEPIFAAWRAYAAIPEKEFAAKAGAVTESLAKDNPKRPVHPLVCDAFVGKPPASLQEAAQRYGELLARFDKAESLSNADEEVLRKVLRGDGAPTNVPLADVTHLFKRDSFTEDNNYKKKIEAFKASSPAAPPRAMALEDAKNIEGQRVFLRGNQGNPGEPVKPHFLTALGGSDPKPFTRGSGRLELAEAIASRDNPLTARVMVNRVWLHHFGFGIVRTPSDFGTRCDPPTHPELLDYLALRFMEDGWSIKKLHRRILLSSTYQMSSEASPDAPTRDPQNLLLSHMNRQRLDFEATRDAMLAVTGKLDGKLYGRSVDITTGDIDRRTVYAYIDRQNLPGLFRNFDFASPDTTSPQRFSTTVPQQALFMMNSPFVARQAKRLTERPEIAAEQNPPKRIALLYRDLFGRAPTADEVTLGTGFVASEEAEQRDALVWQYGFGEVDEQAHRVKSFTRLTHFTGTNWQAGPKLPDPKVGWVTIYANGGHPGDDQQHAQIRRWTAPADGVVRISGTVSHKEANGDGVRARIISSRAGELAAWNVCRGEAQTVLEQVEVKRGDTIDFVVDCRSGPNSDSFAWAPAIRLTDAPAVAGQGVPQEWNAATDFAGPQKADRVLSAWEKYAQVLLESNEFVFVD